LAIFIKYWYFKKWICLNLTDILKLQNTRKLTKNNSAGEKTCVQKWSKIDFLRFNHIVYKHILLNMIWNLKNDYFYEKLQNLQ
jgi:hypothetical protein